MTQNAQKYLNIKLLIRKIMHIFVTINIHL